GSRSFNPDITVLEPVAITTRVASSFIRVGQLELFGRRARKQEHTEALAELEAMILHLIAREYAAVIDKNLSTAEKVVLLAREFRGRLTALVANWVRVGYCQGNFNSDNCAAGGFTLDFGPFGFIERFDPYYQPWTGGGEHFAFFNQPVAAQRNFESFCTALRPLLETDHGALQQLDEMLNGFGEVMNAQMEAMWTRKLGLNTFDGELFGELATLMVETQVDYTRFFRELSALPDGIGPLKKSFYREVDGEAEARWSTWLTQWRSQVSSSSEEMKQVNPKYTLREWLLAPAYQQAIAGDYTLLHELQQVMTQPYAEQSPEVEEKYYRLKPTEAFEIGGVSHMSCSS
ncbi:MAG: protein adenylyltransferase SelO family protein, partial [Chromatiales bacterium]|nr:protein adenylyltransferase SelO family protein [Chromatiales bacterium]